jgi:hypothetical protein
MRDRVVISSYRMGGGTGIRKVTNQRKVGDKGGKRRRYRGLENDWMVSRSG